ncbi:MAG: hypothetical protein HDS38_06845 [Bacteroides sp.]|nr:hypothetical protein [Bacteroides sp.]
MNHALIIFIAVIIALQIFLYIKTGKLISQLKKVLSGDFSTGTTIVENVTVIKYMTDNRDKVTDLIESSINTYLRKNKGAVSDFNLIKDIVERNCDSLEAEIASQTPLPLYLGLMGTVAGIILGLFTITINGGFANIEKVIEILMSDVAIAMVASFMGIGFTTLSLWKSKQCKVTVEANKNRFYTWIQTNLLPVISKSAVSAITLLQKNLTRFNESFTGTIDRLEEKLNNVGDVYSAQIEILDKIEAIDVKKMAMANVKVLSALDGSMGNLERFSKYMESVTEYLIAVRELNSKLDEHLERTETLSVVSDFYKKQMKEIELRQEAIKSTVLTVDDVMRSALESLRSNSEEGLKSMQETFVQQLMTMQQIINKQTEQVATQLNQMPQLMQRLDDVSRIPSKIDNLLERIEKSNINLVRQIGQSMRNVSAVPVVSGQNNNDSTTTELTDQTDHKNSNPIVKWLTIAILGLIAFVLMGILTVNILTYHAQTKPISQTDTKSTLNVEGTQPSNQDEPVDIATRVDEVHTLPTTSELSIPNVKSNESVESKRELPIKHSMIN